MTSIFVLICIILLDIITLNGIKKVFPQFSVRHWRTLRSVFIVQTSIAVAIILFGAIFQKRISDYRMIALYFHFFGGVATENGIILQAKTPDLETARQGTNSDFRKKLQ